jgi:transposase
MTKGGIQMLKRTDVMMIMQMREQGVYIQDIAKEIGCSERTVRRILKRGGPASGKRPKSRGSKLDAFKPTIDALLADEVWNCEVILQELRLRGYDGGVTLLRNYIQPRRRRGSSKATVRFETKPGHQLQHDWGELDTLIAGRKTRAHFVVNTLGYSRRFDCFAGPKQDAEHTYESLVRSFERFGGVPAEVLVDNQRTAVIGRSDGRAIFNDRFLDLAEHYGFMPRACRPYRARTKGKTERNVQYVKNNFFQRYRSFESYEHLNQCLRQWLDEIADQRVHDTHREIVLKRFDRDEAGALKRLNPRRFDTAYRFYRKVAWDGFISVEGNRYSVPDHFCGERVTCRLSLDGELIIYGREDEAIAMHRLTDASAGWQQEREHHEQLWRDAVPVQIRDLKTYEEVA